MPTEVTYVGLGDTRSLSLADQERMGIQSKDDSPLQFFKGQAVKLTNANAKALLDPAGLTANEFIEGALEEEGVSSIGTTDPGTNEADANASATESSSDAATLKASNSSPKSKVKST